MFEFNEPSTPTVPVLCCVLPNSHKAQRKTLRGGAGIWRHCLLFSEKPFRSVMSSAGCGFMWLRKRLSICLKHKIHVNT